MHKYSDLTKRQYEILDFIKRHIVEKMRPPTHKEICAKFNFNSSNSASSHVNALNNKGYLQNTENSHHLFLTNVKIVLMDI